MGELWYSFISIKLSIDPKSKCSLKMLSWIRFELFKLLFCMYFNLIYFEEKTVNMIWCWPQYTYLQISRSPACTGVDVKILPSNPTCFHPQVYSVGSGLVFRIATLMDNFSKIWISASTYDSLTIWWNFASNRKKVVQGALYVGW